MQLSKRIFLVGSEQFALSHPMDCNCYLIDGGSALALIDTGVGLGVEDILANIAASGFRPEALTDIVLTHSHFGHWGGARKLREYTGARVWAHTLSVPAMTDIAREPGIVNNLQFNRYPDGYTPQPCPPDATFGDGDRIRIGDVELRMVHTQGHTKDSTCILLEDNGQRALFTGDYVFYAGLIGLLNLEGCSFDDYRRDIHKLANLSIDMLFPGHGVFVLRQGQKHIQRAIFKLSDFVLPPTFFETNIFAWEREYAHAKQAERH
jgi:glyoxylase-like metal-dependent hydrolase (beta-lactamase superfamily II)